MLQLLAHENLNGSLIRGLVCRQPEIDLVRVQDVGWSGADDHAVLAWAARAGRVVLTHDQATVPKYAYERIEAGLPMPGVFVGNTNLPIQQVINDILRHGPPVAVLWGTGLRVQPLVIAVQTWGLTLPQIAAAYDVLVAQVQEALAFSTAHREAIDAGLAAEDALEAAAHAPPRRHRDADASRKALHAALVARGHDVTRTLNAWRPREAPDAAQLLGATAQGRVLFPFNVRDFPALAQP